MSPSAKNSGIAHRSQRELLSSKRQRSVRGGGRAGMDADSAARWARNRQATTMALHLVHHDLSPAVKLTDEQEEALRRVAEGNRGEDLQASVLEVLVRAHAERLWLACDCRGEGGRPPVNAPCRRLGLY